MNLLLDMLVTGLPLLPAIVGSYLLFRVLNDFDLTIDGSFVTGAGVCVVLMNHGVPAGVAVVIACFAGGATGLVTTLLHVWLRMPILLAGLAMSMMLFSVNLYIMKSPTLSLPGAGLLSPFASLSGHTRDLATSALLLAIDLVLLGLIGTFLKSEVGLALRATGINATMAQAQGVSRTVVVAIALGLANACTALGGALSAQVQGFVDVNGGTGTLIAAVGAILLGELLVRPRPSTVVRAMIALLVGCLLYRLVLVGSLRLGLPATDLKLVMGATLVGAVAIQLGGHQVGARLPAVLGRRPTLTESTELQPEEPRRARTA
jgi:putative ABC transport system permease protein